LLLLLAFNLPDSGHGFDLSCWSAWMTQLDTRPFHRIYDIDCNYLPGYLYLLKFHLWMTGSAEAASHHLHQLKLYTLLFDLGSILLLLSMSNNPQRINLHWGLFAFNAAYLYNTLNWGQIDGIPAFFVLLSLKFLLQKHAVGGGMAYLLALNVKLQMIIFAPIILWLLWDALRGKPLRMFLRVKLAALGLQALLILPFLIGGTVVPLWRVVIGSVGYFQRVSMNAFNFWYLALPESVNPVELDDRAAWFGGLSYHQWGMMLLLISGVLCAGLLFGRRWKAAISNRTFPAFLPDDYLLAGAMLSLLFFFFPTQMHERYSHPAWLFLGLWCIRSGQYMPFIVFSAAYYLNMEMVLRSLELSNYSAFFFQPVFIASLYGILVAYMFYASALQGRRATT
jgi:Gpi18-like mannosyltransferase